MRTAILLLLGFGNCLAIIASAAHKGNPTPVQWNLAWHRVDGSSKRDLDQLFTHLVSTKSGAKIFAMATKKVGRLQQVIEAGDTSITESTYSRSYSLSTGVEKTELKQKIFLGRNLSLSDAVVDLAHELTHLAYREVQNPYEAMPSRKHFIQKGIEGAGGELQAFEMECNVAWELEQKYVNYPTHKLCARYRKKNGGFARESARKDYYATGNVDWPASISTMFVELSKEPVVFLSAHAKEAYPIALNKEYDETNYAVCRNNELKYVKLSHQMGRSLSSLSEKEFLKNETERLKQFQKTRCSIQSNQSIQSSSIRQN